ncbi:hypothetical protein C0Q70_18420 [Pomacea canaliculata]|uniref:CCHC-type domain-containing protein n=1 Tax=Pomacea canaliculata TaxID=400727 RepID=A0A2T7NN72_POMCA|nr:hypothetical protein C0Q70_18420 [Pomacea canaliculata]
MCLWGRYTDAIVLEAVRRSLRGEAARVAMRLGPQATLNELLQIFDSIFGLVVCDQDLLGSFYTARQQAGENVTQWRCRIEDILTQALSARLIERRAYSETLRCRLWGGLRQHLKDRTAYKFEMKTDVDALFRSLRQTEQEADQGPAHKTGAGKQAAVNAAQAIPAEDWSAEVRKLSAEVQLLRRQLQQGPRNEPAAGRAPDQRPPRSRYDDDGPTCFRCGGKGHIQVGCRSTCVEVWVEGVATVALLDTGATVSTVTDTFYRQKLAHLAVLQLQEVLHIECADGQLLPYKGYIEAELRVEGAGGGADSLICLLLVVPSNRYSNSVPVLLGTNILEQLMHRAHDKHGPQFLQNTQLQPLWNRSFRCLAMWERVLRRSHNTGIRAVFAAIHHQAEQCRCHSVCRGSSVGLRAYLCHAPVGTEKRLGSTAGHHTEPGQL